MSTIHNGTTKEIASAFVERHKGSVIGVLHGSRLDWNRIEELYDVFGLKTEAKALREKFDRAE